MKLATFHRLNKKNAGIQLMKATHICRMRENIFRIQVDKNALFSSLEGKINLFFLFNILTSDIF